MKLDITAGGVCTREAKEKKLYKYYSYNECMKTMFAPVLSNTLRYRKPKSFNDPYDCYIATKMDGKIQSARDVEMETVFVSSLSVDCNDILMWSHYASNHKGFAIEYDFDRTCISIQKFKNEKQKQFEKIKFFYVEYSNGIKIRNIWPQKVETAQKEIEDAIYHKSLCWNYEKEVRSVIYDMSNEDFIDISLDPDCISAIILGSQFISTVKKIPGFLKTWNSRKKLFYMQLCSAEYKLDRMSDIPEKYF